MDVKVTERGIHMVDGSEVPVGTVLTLKGETVPASFVNKCVVIGEASAGAEFVTATLPPVPSEPAGLTAVHRGRGSYSVMDGETEVFQGMSKEDAEAFNDLSTEDKAEFVATTGGE